ncbi:hypothetical protein [Rhizobium leguminosarum]|uniref:hypothetical protein n=1 Tax=Rhizobium TaxID=379 RepID=UPI001030A52E|nr:hypothetical protein [Rhizobium leguminosarum]TAV40663.1 hypothetical protein ELI31_35380 [Rhizobium leguminosarum]TAV41231.1 hypothetical protein ELI32_35375 [Rhizobium leguminosarum]TAV61096.1 hypothetical protein ELI30_35165 [Rhizobium leguminosarum]TAY61126.1 hypothetical protein ELH82_33075 [Rhizobium leguminosarum]
MSGITPTTKLLLLDEHQQSRPQNDYTELRRQLSSLPGFESVELTPNGRSTVFATVPAKNQRERERLKTLVNEKIKGWRVIEEQSYSLPSAF